MTPEQRSLRSRIAAYAANSRHDGRAITERARATYRASFEQGHECAVCPAVVLPDDLSEGERARRADLLRRAHYGRLAFKSSRARASRRAGPDRNSGPAQGDRQSHAERPAAA